MTLTSLGSFGLSLPPPNGKELGGATHSAYLYVWRARGNRRVQLASRIRTLVAARVGH